MKRRIWGNELFALFCFINLMMLIIVISMPVKSFGRTFVSSALIWKRCPHIVPHCCVSEVRTYLDGCMVIREEQLIRTTHIGVCPPSLPGSPPPPPYSQKDPEDQWPTPFDYVGGCNALIIYLECDEIYGEVVLFSGVFPDITDWWYFNTTGSDGEDYVCMSSYKTSDGSQENHIVSDYHTIDPIDRFDCLSREAFDALNATAESDISSCGGQVHAFNSGIYTTAGDLYSTYGCVDINGSGYDESADVDCNVTASAIPKGENGDPEKNSGPGSSGECSRGAPVWKVNMVNMNLYITDTPIWYDPPIGPSVHLKLSYNSMGTDIPDNTFGNKWTSNYHSYIVEAPNGEVTVFMPDGREDVFANDEQAGYLNETGVFNKLTKIADNHFELEHMDGMVFVYSTPSVVNDSQTHLSEMIDSYEQKLTFGYGDDGSLVTITDALNRITNFVDNNSDGIVDRVDGPFGRSAYFEYYMNGDLKRIIDMGGYWSEFAYDSDGYITAITNENGTYDFYIEPPSGAINRTISYPAPGRPMGGNYRITITDPLGNSEEYYSFGTYSWYVSPNDYVPYLYENNNNFKDASKTYYFLTESHKSGRISKIIYPEGGYKAYFDYDSISGRPQTIKDFHGEGVLHTEKYTYNINGLIESYTEAKGNRTTYAYYPNNIDLYEIRYDLTGTVEDDDILLGSFIYNSVTHDISAATDRLGNVTEIAYNPYGQIKSITEAANTNIKMTTDMVYDPVNHELEEIRKSGNTVASFTYDNAGRVRTHTDDKNLTITYWDYNNLDQPTQIVFPDTVFHEGEPESKYVKINYSTCCPRLIDDITDRAGLSTIYKYSALKRLLEINGAGGIIKYEYDANGNTIRLIDADSKATAFSYDHDNRLIKKEYADSTSLHFVYDTSGLLSKVVNARGIAKEYLYDEKHNLLNINYSDETPDIAYSYDDYGRRDKMTDGIGTYLYGYDVLNRLIGIDGPWENDSISFQYNAFGHLENIVPQGGRTVTYSYDYDSENTESFDMGRVNEIKVGEENYTYNFIGSASSIKNLRRPNNGSTDYTYNDPLKRLTEISNKNSAMGTISKHEFSYNTLDLIDAETITSELQPVTFEERSQTYNHNNVNQLLSSTGPSELFEYDDDGNMIRGYTPDGDEFEAVYDAENRLASIKYSDGIDHETKYYYNGDGLLVKTEKLEDNAFIDEVRILRAGFLSLQERNSVNQVVREYTWGIDMGGGVGGLLNMRQEGQDYSYLYDGKGNVTGLVDSYEQVAASYRYDAFGNLIARTGELDQPYRFSTKRYDEATGLLYYGYRFYNSSIGRWMTRDPLGEAGGINLYGFTGNNPVNFIDPLGFDPRGVSDPYPSHSWDSNYSTALDNPVLKCHVATHNDPVENIVGAAIVGGPLLGLVGAEVLPVAVSGIRTAAVTVLSNPATVVEVQKHASDFISGIPSQLGPPTPSPAGYLGVLTGQGYSVIKRALKNRK